MRPWLALALTLAAPLPLAGQETLRAHALGGLRADVVALIATGRDGGAFPAAVTAAPRPGGGERVPVDLWVEADGAGLLGDLEEGTLRPEFYVYAIREDGVVGGYLSLAVRVGLAEHGAALRAGHLKLYGRLELVPGRYELRAVVREPRSQRFALRTLPLAVAGAEDAPVPPSSDDPGTVWILPEAVKEDTGLALPPVPEISDERRRFAKRRREVSDAYREVIERLATSGVEVAVGGLVRLEEEAAASVRTSAGGNLLSAAEGDVIARLSEHGAEVLLPIFVLHLEAYERYVETSRPALAAYARGRLRTLSRLYRDVARREDEPSRALMAEGMALFGDSLVLSGMHSAGRSIFEDALEIDGRNASALVGLARAHERLGEYGEAASVLERLLAERPESEEGRLRLAVCRVRMDLADAAEPLLRALIDRGREPWIVVLAYEELARIYLDRGRFQDAVRLLEEAVGRHPSAERLYLALAYAKERGGDRRGGDGVLAGAARTKAPTPRYTYGRSFQEGREEIRRQLRGASLARLALLQRALAAEEGGS